MKLTNVPVVFISPDHNQKYTERKNHMLELLNKIGFKTIVHHKSGNEAYPNCLLKANIAILEQYMNDEPVLIIEDDVEPFVEINTETELDMPDDTDAFYLGFSKSGGSKTLNLHDGFCVVNPISKTHIRIMNMLTTHAIIYKSKRYKERAISEFNTVLNNPDYYLDVIISRIHSSYNVYGYYYPLFYQSVKWGNVQHTEDYTKFEFVNISSPNIKRRYSNGRYRP